MRNLDVPGNATEDERRDRSQRERKEPQSRVRQWQTDDVRGLPVLRAILAASIVSTALHYTHNYVEIDHYPASSLASSATVRLLILIVWPTLTAIGLLGYWLYAKRLPGAYACLMLYSTLGLVTLGHFTSGSPHIPPFFYATIFTDAAAGVAVLAFAAWSALASAAPADRVRR